MKKIGLICATALLNKPIFLLLIFFLLFFNNVVNLDITVFNRFAFC